MGVRQRSRSIGLSAAVAVLLLAGCADPDPAGPSAQPGQTGPPPGQAGPEAFQVTAITEDGLPRPPVGETGIVITVDGGTITVAAGCNGMSGRVSVDGQRLTVSDLISTGMFCGEELGGQEIWLSAFLAEGPGWQRTGGELVLRTAGAELRLTAQDRPS